MPDPAGGPKTAFVLGGARNLGAMQVGMLKALVGAGVTPDVVVGCSVGAINGAGVALEPSVAGIANLERIWLEAARRDVWPVHPARIPLELLRRGSSVNGNEGLRAVLMANLPDTFEELALPFRCVAADLETGRAHWFHTGPLSEAILASAALPGILPPVEVDGRLLIDGAAVDVVPVAAAVALGATRLFVLQVKDLDAAPPVPRRPLDVVLRAFAISRGARFLAELEALPATVEVHVLPVVDWPRFRYDGFSRTAELIELSRARASEHLEAAAISG